MPQRVHRFLIPLAAIFCILPILLTGPSCGHDFDFHVLSWLEAASQFAQLHYPQWAYTPAFNAGEPRFLFYPPLSWLIGALLGSIFPWTLVPAAFTFLCLTLAGVTAYRLASRYASPPAATLAAILYLANPYMLFTAYERTAYGELLAAAWLPLLFAAALAPRLRIVPLAVPIALLWLSNAPAGVFSSYALAILILTRLTLPSRFAANGPSPRTSHPVGGSPQSPYLPSSSPEPQPQAELGMQKLHVTLTATTATLLGLTLAAFYLLPAAYEQRFVQSDMATVEGMRIADNTLFHRMPYSLDHVAHDLVLHTASVIAITLFAAVFVTFALSLTRPRVTPVPLLRDPPPSLSSLFPLLCLIAFLLTPLSLPVWSHTPELRFLQFPWRLTALLATLLVITAALALDRLPRLAVLSPLRATMLPILLVLALVTPAWLSFRQPCDPEDTIEARTALFHSSQGTDPTDEYTPTTADNDALKPGNPPYWLISQNQPNACDQPAPVSATPGQAPQHLTLAISQPELLILNRRDFPTWCATVNGHPAQSCGRNDGLIAVALPVGHDTIDLRSRTPPDQQTGLALSALALIVTIALSRRASRPPERIAA